MYNNNIYFLFFFDINIQKYVTFKITIEKIFKLNYNIYNYMISNFLL